MNDWRIILKLMENHRLDCSGPGQGQVAGACEWGNEISGFINCEKYFD
jgi:hypothetical protein